MKRVYLDYAASTPVDERVLQFMKPYFSKKFGNASSLHRFGQEAKKGIDESREKVSKLINSKDSEIIFTSSGTEGDNLAIKGTAFANRDKGKHIIISRIEHHAILETCKWLEGQGFEVTYLPVDKYGLVDIKQLESSIRKDTILVSVMHANNEIGTIEPTEEIGKLCKEHGVLFHTDAVQTFGKIKVDVNKMNVDLLTASSHKIYGPKGVGMLFVREGTRVEPLIHGGGQESGLRSSTENVAGIVGFGVASEIAKKEMNKDANQQTRLRDYMIKNVLKIDKSHLNGHRVRRLPNNANFYFDFIEGESLITHLDFYGIAASTGSACSSRSLEPSHVLLAIGLKHEEAHGSLRLTLGRPTTKDNVNYVLKMLPGIVDRLREISPLKK